MNDDLRQFLNDIVMRIVFITILAIVIVLPQLVWHGCKDYQIYSNGGDPIDLVEACVKWSIAGVVIAAIVVPLLITWRRRILHSRTVKYDRCRKCNYPLEGLTSTRCPECGTPFNPNLVSRQPPKG